jgi:hypothetical protein
LLTFLEVVMMNRMWISLLFVVACAGDVTSQIDADPAAPATETAAAEAAMAQDLDLEVLDFHDEAVASFLREALAGNLGPDAEMTYAVLVRGPDGEPMDVDVTVGVSNEIVATQSDASLMIDYALHWCEEVGPTVSKTIWATSCTKSVAKSTAESWARSLADDQCEATLRLADGTAACAPDNFDDNICVSGTGSITSTSQSGSQTACGFWPFQYQIWKATYAFTGDCGYNCSTDPAPY